ncbi:MAG: CvpA family protein [Clostridia bacterium]|nr:CvpA family protein [Clostridia bacterium]
MDYTYLIFDLVILAALAVFAIRGAHRGLLLSLFSLVAVVVAFVGANFAATHGAPLVAKYLEPRFQQVIELRLDEEIKARAAEGTDSIESGAEAAAPDQLPLQDVLDVLKGMGLYRDLIATIDKAVQDGMTEVAAGAAASVAAAVAQSVAYMALFLITFILIMILWTILSRVLDLVARLPGLSTLNHLGGALFGLVKCCIFLFLCAWVLRYSGTLIPEETVEKTYLLKFFLTTNPVTLLLGV